MLLQGNQDYYEYAAAGKTGYTTEAENTLITLAENAERRLVCVVLHTYGGHPYSDTRELLEYGFNNFEEVPIMEHDESGEYSWVEDGAYVMLPKKVSFEKLDREVVLHEDGTDNATVTYYYKDMPVGTCEVTVSENYYNAKKAENEPEEIKEEKPEPKKEAGEEKKERKDNKERYKAAAAIGVAAILTVCSGIAVIVTRITRKRKQKRRR